MCGGALAELARRLYTKIHPRLIAVLDLRLEQTLAEVGRQLGVSRERVRQLEEKGRMQLGAVVREWDVLYERQWRDQLLSCAVSEEELFAALRDPTFDAAPQNRIGRLALATLIPEVRHPRRFMRGMLLDGWWTLDAAALHQTLRMLGARGPLTHAELGAIFRKLRIPCAFPTAALLQEARSPLRFHARAGVWVRSRAFHRDAAVALLRRARHPMAPSALARKLGLNTKALNANLVRDQRVKRTRSPQLWALVDLAQADERTPTIRSVAVRGRRRSTGKDAVPHASRGGGSLEHVQNTRRTALGGLARREPISHTPITPR